MAAAAAVAQVAPEPVAAVPVAAALAARAAVVQVPAALAAVAAVPAAAVVEVVAVVVVAAAEAAGRNRLSQVTSPDGAAEMLRRFFIPIARLSRRSAGEDRNPLEAPLVVHTFMNTGFRRCDGLYGACC
jgi:hypothetical protein